MGPLFKSNERMLPVLHSLVHTYMLSCDRPTVHATVDLQRTRVC